MPDTNGMPELPKVITLSYEGDKVWRLYASQTPDWKLPRDTPESLPLTFTAHKPSEPGKIIAPTAASLIVDLLEGPFPSVMVFNNGIGFELNPAHTHDIGRLNAFLAYLADRLAECVLGWETGTFVVNLDELKKYHPDKGDNGGGSSGSVPRQPGTRE